ncbi:MAG: GTPase HflX [Nitrospinota bacterium]
MLHLELGRALAELSRETGRQLALLVDRAGFVQYVVAGGPKHVVIPDLKRARGAGVRLRGLRCVHTHLDGSRLSQEDLADLAILRLDAMAALSAEDSGLPGRLQLAHLLPENAEGRRWALLDYPHLSLADLDFLALVHSLEEEFARSWRAPAAEEGKDRAALVAIDRGDRPDLESSIEELKTLATSSGLVVAEVVVQRRPKPHPRYWLGPGRLGDLLARCLQKGVDILLFEGELAPAQVKAITDFTDLKVIDRTQLILDIFAQRAHSRAGQLQVELAQLRYMLPRLTHKGTALSRLAGGIGGRGPGEQKLEVDRRRARERIHRLERQLGELRERRAQARALRRRRDVPVLSIVGYTNAGKSTLLNALTESNVFVEERPFATLDPTSRRLRLPRDQEVIVTDTVGFIRELPRDLLEAFRATLEEMEDADLLLHVVDASDPECEAQLLAVESILGEIGLGKVPVLRVFNKVDRTLPGVAANLSRRYRGVAVCSLDPRTLPPLVERAAELLRRVRDGRPRAEVEAGNGGALRARGSAGAV